MAIAPLGLLILASLLGSFANEDLQHKVFVFPEASNNAGVTLKTSFRQPLTSFTVCLRYYTLLTRSCGLFSYATKRTDNELLLYKPGPNQYNLYVGGSTVTFSLPGTQESTPRWEHICMSWESSTGLVALWVDGHPLPRMGMKKGYSIDPDASIVLGQDQDSFGGSFEIHQSFVGEIADVYMWERAFSAEEVRQVRSDRSVNDSLINWRSLNYEIRGYVVAKPSFPGY